MSTTDNWLKLYRWWQEHLKSHFHSSSSNLNGHSHQKRNSLLHRRASLMLFRSSSNNVPSRNAKKRASFGGIEQEQHIDHTINDGDFRHVRDSIRTKSCRATRLTTITTNSKRLVI